MRLVLVEWGDAHSGDEWQSLDEVGDGVYPVRSVGWALRDTDESLVLVSSLAVDTEKWGEAGFGTLTIPRGMIAKITTLRRK